MLRPPRICSCGKKVAFGATCVCQRHRDAERKALFDQRRPSARARGYDSKWDQARKGYLASHPKCCRCGEPATLVDHVIPHRGDMKQFWKKSNWQALCTRCHSGAKQSEEKRARGVVRDFDQGGRDRRGWSARKIVELGYSAMGYDTCD